MRSGGGMLPGEGCVCGRGGGGGGVLMPVLLLCSCSCKLHTGCSPVLSIAAGQAGPLTCLPPPRRGAGCKTRRLRAHLGVQLTEQSTAARLKYALHQVSTSPRLL
jgi:hypothetical protein